MEPAMCWRLVPTRSLNPFLDGDIVELEIEGLGRLTINVQDDLRRTWERIVRSDRTDRGLEPPHAPQLTVNTLKHLLGILVCK